MTQPRSAISVAIPRLALDDDVQLAARVDVPVLITAESHDQRAACARVIHATGAHARGPFVPLRSSEISPRVDDSPAVVRALRRHFDQARGGTLFIDDIATLPPVAQRGLLTLLDERALSGVSSNGAPDPRAVRIITGASRHLVVERATGAFCESLFYRLNVVHLDPTIQPVSERTAYERV